MHLARFIVDLIHIKPAAEVLRQPRAEADRFAECHVMQKPVRQPGPRAGQSVTRTAQRGPREIILRVPISKETAMQNREDRLNVGVSKITAVAYAIRMVVTAAARAVGPQISVRA